MLLADGTYFVLESGNELVACGGWSRRDKLYTGSGDSGADARAQPRFNQSSQHLVVDLIVNIDRALPQEFASRASSAAGCSGRRRQRRGHRRSVC